MASANSYLSQKNCIWITSVIEGLRLLRKLHIERPAGGGEGGQRLRLFILICIKLGDNDGCRRSGKPHAADPKHEERGADGDHDP